MYNMELRYYNIIAPNGRILHGQYLTEEWAQAKREQGYKVTLA